MLTFGSIFSISLQGISTQSHFWQFWAVFWWTLSACSFTGSKESGAGRGHGHLVPACLCSSVCIYCFLSSLTVSRTGKFVTCWTKLRLLFFFFYWDCAFFFSLRLWFIYRKMCGHSWCMISLNVILSAHTFYFLTVVS